jgi:hypothetical protein
MSRQDPASTTAWLRVPLSGVWCAAAIVAPVWAVTAAPLGALDLVYHLRAGAAMLGTRSLIREDGFTFTAAGLPWFDQQWGSQIVLEGLFRAGGWFALAATRSLFAAVTLVLVYLACRARGATRRVAAWLTLASGFLVFPAVDLRPELFGTVCFALTLWLLAVRHAHPARLWLIPAVVVVWANTHGTFFLAPGLIGLAWLEDLRERRPAPMRLVAVGFIAVAATLVNPFGPDVWRYVIELTRNPSVRTLAVEWQPPTIRSYSGALFLISVPAAAMLVVRGTRPVPWPAVLALASFFAIGVTSIRGTTWWALAAPVIVAGSSPWLRGREPRSDPVNAGNSVLVLLFCVVLAIIGARWLPYTGAEPVPERLLGNAPPGITRELRAVLRPGERLFNAQAWGSWFEFALPDNPVAADARIEVLPAAVWSRYRDVSNGREGWQRALRDWNVRVAALSPRQQGPLIERMSADSGWRRVYRDRDGSIFVAR